MSVEINYILEYDPFFGCYTFEYNGDIIITGTDTYSEAVEYAESMLNECEN